jgi:hypothetical protein
LGDTTLEAGDGVALTHPGAFAMAGVQDAEILMFDMISEQ